MLISSPKLPGLSLARWPFFGHLLPACRDQRVCTWPAGFGDPSVPDTFHIVRSSGGVEVLRPRLLLQLAHLEGPIENLFSQGHLFPRNRQSYLWVQIVE